MIADPAPPYVDDHDMVTELLTHTYRSGNVGLTAVAASGHVRGVTLDVALNNRGHQGVQCAEATLAAGGVTYAALVAMLAWHGIPITA